MQLLWRSIGCRPDAECRPLNIRACVRTRRSEEEGFALLDVAIAIVVLMIVLLPIAYLLSTTAKTAATNQHRLTAQSIAASWLSQEQSAGEQAPTAPPPVDNPTGTASTSWPTSPLLPTAETVGDDYTYEVFMAGGWCAYAGPGVRWADGTSSTTTPGSPPPPLTYFIAVKVKWGPNDANPNLTSLNDGSVVEYSSVQSQPGWNVTISPSNASVSPLTLTSTSNIVAPESILPNSPNICPLGLK